MNIVNLSGGKDSTWMLYQMIKRGIKVDLIVFADVGEMAEFAYMYSYLERVESFFGREILRVKSTIHTARSMFYGYPSRGNHIDEIRGFPPAVKRGCRYRDWLKVDPLELVSSMDDDVFIGIAADEAHRTQSLDYAKGGKRYHFPLVDWDITEKMCLEGLKEIGLYNELYDYFNRLGCFWCPKQPIGSLRNLWKHFPELWGILLEMEAAQQRSDLSRPFQYQRSAVELGIRFEAEENGTYRRKSRKKKVVELAPGSCEEYLEAS